MSEEQQVNPIEDLVQAAINQDFTAAADIFNDVMGEKMSDALEQQKIAVASSIYGDSEIEDEDLEDDVEIDDEDLEFDDEEDLEDEDEEQERQWQIVLRTGYFHNLFAS